MLALGSRTPPDIQRDVPTASAADPASPVRGVHGTVIGGRPLRVSLRVDNVLDHAYRDFLSRYKTFALNPGRNISLRVGWDL